MDGSTAVPIEWLFAAAAVITGMFVWWVRSEFTRNSAAHKDIRQTIIEHDKRTTKNAGNFQRRLDHLIHHTPDCPPFAESHDDDTY